MLETPPYTSRLTLRLPKDQSKQRTATKKGGGSPQQTLQPASPPHLRAQTQHHLSNLLHTNGQPRLCKTLPRALRFPRYKVSLVRDLCRRAVPASTQSGAPRHTHTRRRRATSCHGGRTRRTRSPTHLGLPLARRRRSPFISFQSIAHSRGRRPLQLSALHVVINNSKVHTRPQE